MLNRIRLNTDAGSQYVAIAYTERLEELGVAASIGTVGDSFDNAMAESMFALFKTELFRNPAVLARVGGHWKGLDDLEIETAKWVSWFNEERIHSELDDLSPTEVERNYADQSHASAA
ncbi:MAG: integrase core domain-containing protein [Acidimicrobiales bacterium]